MLLRSSSTPEPASLLANNYGRAMNAPSKKLDRSLTMNSASPRIPPATSSVEEILCLESVSKNSLGRRESFDTGVRVRRANPERSSFNSATFKDNLGNRSGNSRHNERLIVQKDSQIGPVSASKSFGVNVRSVVRKEVHREWKVDRPDHLTAQEGDQRSFPPSQSSDSIYACNIAPDVSTGIFGSAITQSPQTKLEEPKRESIPTTTNLSNAQHYTDGSISECGSFLMDDGETYTSFGVGINGLPIVCNAKGCRPLSDSERSRMWTGSLTGGESAASQNGIGGSRRFHHGTFEVDYTATESQYKKSLESSHENPLLLRNFAQFLYEIRNDPQGAEEYYERASLAGSDDGEVMSQYAKLQWDFRKDKDRAESYFQRALHAAPDNCHVLGAYASFLWEAEDDEEESVSASD